ncbi:hypothetical protein [Marinithermofilum abyssi]|nr:hypothetical protein [Marinithermofilum abyssi]
MRAVCDRRGDYRLEEVGLRSRRFVELLLALMGSILQERIV